MFAKLSGLVLGVALLGATGVAQAQSGLQDAPAYGTPSAPAYGTQSGSQANSQSGSQSNGQSNGGQSNNGQPHRLFNLFGNDSPSGNGTSGQSSAASQNRGNLPSGSNFNTITNRGNATNNSNTASSSSNSNNDSSNSNSQSNPPSVRSNYPRPSAPVYTGPRVADQSTTPKSGGTAPLYKPAPVPAQPLPDTQAASPRDTRPLADRLRSPVIVDHQVGDRQIADRPTFDHGPIVNAGVPEDIASLPDSTPHMAEAAPLEKPSSRRQVKVDVAEEITVPANPLPDRASHPSLAEETSISGPAKFVGSSRRPIAAADMGGPVADTSPPLAANNVLVNHQSPQLSVETIGPRTIMIGKEAMYKVVLKNTGEVAAQDVIVGVKIPEWTDVAGTQTSAGATRPNETEGLQWRLPRLDARSKETLSLRLVPRKGKPFDLAVQWTFTPVSEQTVVEVQEPKLAMNVTGPEEVTYGQSKVYRLTVSNPGTGPAENVVIQLAPIGNPNGSPTQQSLGTLRAGDSKVIELELTARQAGNITIHATASAEPGLKAESTEEVLVRRAAVAVTVDGAKVKYAGTTAIYAIQVSNPGNAVAENVHVIATLPPEAKFVSASDGGQWKAEQGKVVWTMSNLKPGESGALEMKCTLMAPGPNRLQIASNATGDVSDTANITTHVEALADLKLNVSEPAGPIAVGDDVVYELRIRNRGSKSAEGVGVVAYFSEGIEPTSAQGGANDIANGVVAFRPIASLPIGGEVIYKIHAKAQRTGKQVFRAEVECNTLGTKLVSAEESTIYGDELGGTAHSHEAVASRLPVPSDMQQPAQAPGTQNQPVPMVIPMQVPGGNYQPGLRR